MAKYEMVMSKPNYEENINYYRSLDNASKVSDSINNYNNPNSITGTNSTELYLSSNQSPPLVNQMNQNQRPVYNPASIHPLHPHLNSHTISILAKKE